MKFVDFFRDIGPVVSYHPRINRITGSVTATIFLSNLLAWEGHQRDPEGWIYKTRDDITEETGLTRYEQETARKHLKERGLLEEKLKGVPATTNYRLNLDAINAAWDAPNKIEVIPPTSRGKSPQLDGGKSTNRLGEKPPFISEDTPVNTQEITQEEMWTQLRLLGIPDRPTYIRLVGRSPFDDPIQTVEFARRKLAEKKRRA